MTILLFLHFPFIFFFLLVLQSILIISCVKSSRWYPLSILIVILFRLHIFLIRGLSVTGFLDDLLKIILNISHRIWSIRKFEFLMKRWSWYFNFIVFAWFDRATYLSLLLSMYYSKDWVITTSRIHKYSTHFVL